ncbi:MAG: type II CRISPR-associated endonuclease Cas1 [Thermoguttaceae bacterium]
MPHQILDFSRNPARLRMRLRQLIIEPKDAPPQTVPFEDIAVLLISHPQVTLSQSVLENIAESGCVLIACNRKSLPVGMFLPLTGHHQPSRRIQLQINAPQPLLKRAWQQIIQAKISAQGTLLRQLFGTDVGLLGIAGRVKSGDTGNLEAQAARRYWKQLFAGYDFLRNPDGDDTINLRLNFGYGVLRGIVARAVCATGFNPTIGLHHHNQYNAYCLADDLMEPFRPLVDRVVREQLEKGGCHQLTPTVKEELIAPLLGRFLLDGEQRTLFDVVGHLAISLVHFFARETQSLAFPDCIGSQ